MALFIFDVIGWLIEKGAQLLGALVEAVMKLLSAVSGVVFGPITRGADWLFGSWGLGWPWAVLIVLGSAMLLLVLLAVVGWIIIAVRGK